MNKFLAARTSVLILLLKAMEPPMRNDTPEDFFSDALDHFQFDDSDTISDHSDQSTSVSAVSESLPPISSPPNTLRRRLRVSGSLSKGLDTGLSPIESNADQFHDCKARLIREKRYKLYRDGTESTGASPDCVAWERVDSVEEKEDVEEGEKSTVTTEKNDDRGGDSVDSTDEFGNLASSNLLVFIAGILIKAIGFQFNLFICFITFPVWVLYWVFVCISDPFGAIRRGRGFIRGKIVSLCNLVSEAFGSLMNDWFKEHETIWNLLSRFGWGLFWSVYVCIILCGLLVFSIIFSGFFMRYLVEEPIKIRQVLNFDYTKNSPVAFVPVMSCSGVSCGVNCEEEIGDIKSLGRRVIPTNHKLQATVSLTLPESEYNRNLGIFQVRVDFLSVDGKTLASKSHPCMLKFKSEPIRLVLTFLKAVPLVAGYISESQTVELKMRDFTEGFMPTSCLKVLIEQRAEFAPGAGIPEIYDASLLLESELPFLKRIIWCWKKTLFIWITMMSFMMELLFTLICCGAVIFRGERPTDGSAINHSTSNNLPQNR